MCVRVFLADDAEVVRRAIRSLLSEREDIKVVGEAATFPEALQKMMELKPDVVVFDLHMFYDDFSTPLPAATSSWRYHSQTMMKRKNWLRASERWNYWTRWSYTKH